MQAGLSKALPKILLARNAGADPGAGARGPWPPPLQEKAPFLGLKHWYFMKIFLILVMKSANFGPKSGPWRQKWGQKYTNMPSWRTKLGAILGPPGPNCPHFSGLATPHEKSWICPCNAFSRPRAYLQNCHKEIYNTLIILISITQCLRDQACFTVTIYRIDIYQEFYELWHYWCLSNVIWVALKIYEWCWG